MSPATMVLAIIVAVLALLIVAELVVDFMSRRAAEARLDVQQDAMLALAKHLNETLRDDAFDARRAMIQAAHEATSGTKPTSR